MSHSLDGRAALVTGAGSGIGREIALGLVRLGVWVAGVGGRAGPLREAADRARALAASEASAGRLMAFPADLRDPGEADRAAAAVTRELGFVSMLVNNAGVAEYAPVPELSLEQWDRMMAVNLRAPFLLTRALLPAMIEAGEGHVIMNVSVAGIRAFPGCGAYGASKTGLLGFTRVLRRETLGTGVRVTGGDRHPDVGRPRPAAGGATDAGGRGGRGRDLGAHHRPRAGARGDRVAAGGGRSLAAYRRSRSAGRDLSRFPRANVETPVVAPPVAPRLPTVLGPVAFRALFDAQPPRGGN
jgi:2-hydroxycyclohexanecarboxyl-CoA dehydrogenase